MKGTILLYGFNGRKPLTGVAPHSLGDSGTLRSPSEIGEEVENNQIEFILLKLNTFNIEVNREIDLANSTNMIYISLFTLLKCVQFQKDKFQRISHFHPW